MGTKWDNNSNSGMIWKKKEERKKSVEFASRVIQNIRNIQCVTKYLCPVTLELVRIGT